MLDIHLNKGFSCPEVGHRSARRGRKQSRAYLLLENLLIVSNVPGLEHRVVTNCAEVQSVRVQCNSCHSVLVRLETLDQFAYIGEGEGGR